MISPGRLLWLLRRDLGRGWSASYHHYRTLPMIAEWTSAYWGEPPLSVPVHVLTGARDWLLAAWMLASFVHHSDEHWQIVIHDDGTLPEEAKMVLGHMFRTCHFVPRFEADVMMSQVLQAHPACQRYRASHPLGLKIFDIPHFAKNERFLILDSDVLFFRKPQEIVDWTKAEDSLGCWFNEDVQESSLVSTEEAHTNLDINLWPRVNSGLCLLDRAAIDYDLCEQALTSTSMLKGPVWRVEQTLFALNASRHGKGGRLPKTYEVSLQRHAASHIVARHYVGAVRDRFYGEGLKRLAPVLLPGSD